jgi:NADH:ubiquinone oxidoreductase subunit 5 (subunit L)/multisubunit Na+/H+ antiporter MnhA subunit
MPVLVYPILLLPLAAALFIGVGLLCGRLQGDKGERLVASVARGAIYLSFLLALLLPGLTGTDRGAVYVLDTATWLASGEFTLQIAFVAGGLHTWLCVLFALLFVVVFRFASQYIHVEAGFQRFFFFMCLFAFAMYLLVLSANAVLTFVAWELAGICSWLLIAYNFRRAQAAANGTRIFIIQRCGDAAFLLGIVLLLLWTGSADWYALAGNVAGLGDTRITLLAVSFALAAFVKSGQFPFTPWLFRAMEGPTPSSAVFYGAVMVHAGVYLVLLLEALFARSGFASGLLIVVGSLTCLYGVLIGRSQTDIKSSLACATSCQTGLMFVECGLGWWDLAFWHLCANAVLQCYLFLSSPSILHNARDVPVPAVRARWPWLRMASLQQGWLDPLLDWAVVRPVQRLAHDLTWFEVQVLDPLVGTPAPLVQRVATLLQQEEGRIGARLENDHDSFAHGSGLAGKLTEVVATLSNWFEERFILQGVGRDMISLGRFLGHAANRFEQLLLRPRYLVMFVLITLLVTL